MLTYTIGNFFERATAALTGGKLVQIDQSQDYCPDVRISERLYGESKSIGKSARAIIYEDRAVRQHKWCQDKQIRLNYFFWKHNVKASKIQGKLLLRRALARNCKELVIIDELLLTDLIDTPPWVINKANPVNYGSGWLLPWKKIREACTRSRTQDLQVGVYKFTDLKIFTP